MKRALFFLFLYLPFGLVLAGDDLLGALSRMQSALQTLNYQGTLVFWDENEVRSMRLIHKADQNGEIERIVNLKGVAREVIRKNDVVTCYLPDSKSVTVGKQHSGKGWLSNLVGSDFATFQAYYDFQLEGDDRVAGYAAQRVLIRPKDAYRYGYRLWLDKGTDLLLKSDLLNEEGKPLEQMMFAELDVVDNINAAMLQPTTNSDGFTWYEDNEQAPVVEANDGQWRIGQLPEGFKVVKYTRHPLPGSEVLADHIMVSDGMASVSVFIEKLADEKNVFKGPFHKGAANVYGAVVDGHQVTVVGEVPSATVEMIASSIQPKDQEAGHD